MSDSPRQLTRNQLAEFLPNQRAVRVFEQLLKQVGNLLPADVVTLNRLIEETYVEAASGSAKADEALDALNRIAQSLELLASAPVSSASRDKDDLTPVSRAMKIGDLADVRQNQAAAGNVLIFDGTLGRFVNALLTQGANVTITNADGAITITVAGAPPTGAAGGVLSGTYPNPGFAVDMATQAELDAHTGATGASVHGLGTVSTLASDTDGTLAANSDMKVATQKAVKTYVDNAVTGLLDFKGSINCSANPNYPAALKGDAYYVTAAGKIGGASGISVDIGDMIVASADNAGGTQASVGSSWFILEHNLVGALLSANNLSDLTNAATARTNLGLGTMATQNANAVAVTGGTLDGVTRFSTSTGSITLAASTTGSIFSPTGGCGFILSVAAANGDANTSGACLVFSRYGASLPVLVTLGSSGLSFSASGNNVQITNNTAFSYTYNWSALRLVN